MCIKYFENPGKTLKKDFQKNPFLGTILDIGAGLLIPGLGAALAPELGAAFGVTDAAELAIGSDALAGAGLEGTAAAAQGKNFLTGALEGAVGGGIEGAGGLGAVAKDVGLDGVVDSVGSGLSDVGNALGLTSDAGATDSMGVPGGVAAGAPGTPTAAVGATGSTAPSSGIDSLNSDSVDSALNNTSGINSIGDAFTSKGAGTGISGADIGGFQNAPELGATAPLTASGGTTGLNASDTLEQGGGFTWDSALNSTPSSSASSASVLSSGPSLDAGGGLQASTGVKPVSDSLLSDLGGALSKIPVKSLAPAASLAYQALSGPPKLPAAERALLGQYQGAEGAALNEYSTGVLTPSQQASLDQQHQDLNNATYQQFASMGITNPQGDSRFVAAMQQNAAKIEAQKQQYMDSAGKDATNFGAGIQSLGQEQLNLDKQYSDEIGEASKALFELLG